MFDSEHFTQAVKSVIGNSNVDYHRDLCPDQYVGNLDELDVLSDDFITRKGVESAPLTQCRVLLILESPHKAEFIQPIGPAKGKTGKLIRRHITRSTQKPRF